MHVSGRETEPRYDAVYMRGCEEERKLGVRGLKARSEVEGDAGDTPGNAFSSSGTGLFMRRTHVAGGVVYWM